MPGYGTASGSADLMPVTSSANGFGSHRVPEPLPGSGVGSLWVGSWMDRAASGLWKSEAGPGHRAALVSTVSVHLPRAPTGRGAPGSFGG